MDEEQYAPAEKLARDVMLYARNTLLVNLRFLDVALSQFQLTPYDGTLTTDGKTLAYGVLHTLKKYKNSKEDVVRGYLHAVMHCIFRHMFVNPAVDRDYWDLACDIAVEYSISGLDLNCARSPREAAEWPVFAQLLQKMSLLTAEKSIRTL